MSRRSRTRRVLKWVATVLCAAIAGTAVWSHWNAVIRSPNDLEKVQLYAGVVEALWIVDSELQRLDPASVQAIGPFPRTPPRIRHHSFSKPLPFEWRFPSFQRAGDFQRYLIMPLWLPFAVFAGPTLILWFLDRRRRFPRGHCQKCGYDLTGNVSGRCPECGTPVRHEAKTE